MFSRVGGDTKYPFMLHMCDNCQILLLASEMLHLHVFFFFFCLILAARVESRIRMFLVGQFQFSRDAQLAEVLFTWFLYLRYFHMC